MRIRSITHGVGLTEAQLRESTASNSVCLDDAKEWKLAKYMLKFPEIK
jgi:hypothetical protein